MLNMITIIVGCSEVGSMIDILVYDNVSKIRSKSETPDFDTQIFTKCAQLPECFPNVTTGTTRVLKVEGGWGRPRAVGF